MSPKDAPWDQDQTSDATIQDVASSQKPRFPVEHCPRYPTIELWIVWQLYVMNDVLWQTDKDKKLISYSQSDIIQSEKYYLLKLMKQAKSRGREQYKEYWVPEGKYAWLKFILII